MEVIRITTAGSVDDGKSTLIGRLLYDTQSIAKDKLEAIETASKRKGLDFTDLSLLTDGLIAEREQGITIDVAYIYFSTANRKFIIADTPGHIEYTRNMITGASTASVFLILVDARNGITEQTRRHFYIASLLRVKEIAVCINKMDLVDCKEDFFIRICDAFKTISGKTGIECQDIFFIPVIAKDGDNIVKSSARMKWYSGPTLLEFLENIEPGTELYHQPARFPVQYVIRPHQKAFHDFRGYAGRMISGMLKEGDEVVALPSMRSSKIKSVLQADKSVQQALAKESVVLTLHDDIDISRGNMLVKINEPCREINSLSATICWMTEQPMKARKTFLLKHGINRVKAKIASIESVLDILSLEPDMKQKHFNLNDIGKVKIILARPIFADLYSDNTANGTFVLIDEFTNNTVAVGFIDEI
jgi:sulfate adenylyltransferase subunit 1